MNSQLLDTTVVVRRGQGRAQARKNEWILTLTSLAFGDALCIALGFYLAYALRFWTGWEVFQEGSMQPELYSLLIGVLVPVWILLYALYGLYSRRYIFGGTQEYARIFNASTLGTMMVVLLTFLEDDFVIARAWLLLSWLLILAFTAVWRFSFRRIIYLQHRRGRLLQRVLILGANAEGRAVAEQLRNSKNAGTTIVGFVDDALAPGAEVLPGVPVLGSATAFEALVEQYNADAVIIADTTMVRERLPAIVGAMEALRRLDVSLAPGLFELLTIGVEVREQAGVPLLSLNKMRITGMHAFGKALVDRVGALVALTLFSPILIAIAVAVYFDSKGPVVYRRRVMGAGNHPFDAFKFRTMHVNGDRLLTPEQRRELQEEGKLKDDPRITRVGAFLRRTSLDELPQLFNVLLGQMSIVGPRMLTQEELRHFGRWRHNLLTVRPGLTGLWQISGRSDLGYEDRVRLDMHYIRNYSLWLDLYIILRTIPIVITGRGAY
jgi:exopolysaccharide biosynthesis polyprenyl glycosylphosphotransferase